MSNQIGMILVAVAFASSLLLVARATAARQPGCMCSGGLAHAVSPYRLGGGVRWRLLGFEDAEVHDYLLGSLDNVSADSLVYVVLGCGLSLAC